MIRPSKRRTAAKPSSYVGEGETPTSPPPTRNIPKLYEREMNTSGLFTFRGSTEVAEWGLFPPLQTQLQSSLPK